MEAKNFRIGNFIGITEQAKKDVFDTCHIDNPEALLADLFIMSNFSDDELNLHVGNELIEFSWQEVEPIVLTREWFVKLGFTRKRHGQAYYLENLFSLEFTQDPNSVESNTWFLIRQGSSKVLSKPIKYIHELQNLFFAITGDELQLKNES